VPVAAYAAVSDGRLVLQALVSNLNGKKVIRDSLSGSPLQVEDIGRRLADRMLSQGAAQILREAENGQ
jgi:hydroxymethylbilane synthase